MTDAVDMRVSIGALELKNPVLTASGTFGYGLEYDDFFDVAQLGGICTKGLSLAPRHGNAPAQPLLTLRCDLASRRVILTRYGAGQGAIVIRTSYGAVSWPATAQGGAQPALVAARAASDGVLDQMAYSRGKIGVDASGIAPLVVPVWAEIARVVEDCRA